MIRHLAALASACALAALLATGAHAQDGAKRCPDGDADDDGISIRVSVGAHPTRVAHTLDSLLVAGGYQVNGSPTGTGRWSIAPRFTWPEEMKDEELAQGPHPGVQVVAESEAEGDSTHVQVGARALCSTGETEMAVELLAAAALATDLTAALDTLRAAGVDVAAAVERPGRYSLQAPEEVAGFRIIGRHDYEDPAAGINIRYGRRDQRYVDIYVYPGTPPDCDAACGARHVNEEADGFVADIPEMVRRGYYERMAVRGDETLPVPAGAPWLFGRHLTLEVKLRGQEQESEYYLFAFPGYKVKVRATYPRSADMAADVRRFVDELLPAMVSRS